MPNDYGHAHQLERAAWAPIVAAGGVECRRGERCRAAELVIHPAEAWDLGHPDAECPTPTAPEHLGCNRRTAARRPGRRAAEVHPAFRFRAG